MSKTKMRIAVVMSESPALARKDFELGLALYDSGHKVVFIKRVGSSSKDIFNFGDRVITTMAIRVESSIEYSYKVHLVLSEQNFSVAIGHSYKAPLYFEAMHGGTPLVVIHEDSFLFDPLVQDEVVNRNALWTQHLLQLHTLRSSEKVVSYSKKSAGQLVRSGVQAEVLEEPVKLSFGELNAEDRESLTIVFNGTNIEATMEFVNSMGLSFETIHWVKSENIYEHRDAFRESFAALVLCDAPTLDIMKFGCTVVKTASEGESFEGIVSISPDEDKLAYSRGLSYVHSSRVGEQAKLKKALLERSYDNLLEQRLEKVLFDAIPEAIVRGRTRGW